jgi:hypothetical protein
MQSGAALEESVKAVGYTEEDLRTLTLKDFDMDDLHPFPEQAESGNL